MGTNTQYCSSMAPSRWGCTRHGAQTRRPPHTRDEVYVVMRGTGQFQNGNTRVEFGPGDVLFVPAGRDHRFERFTDDLALWVLFYGPEGGEAA